MGIILLPEIKLARRIIIENAIKVPFDIDQLVGKYARIVYKSIPFEGVDGICLNLKTGKIPTVVVNNNSPRTRQKFTLAHELGHIIIPWHYGNIIDDLDTSTSDSNKTYWELEREANRFASELLMPFDWIFSLYKINPDREKLISDVCWNCGVSETAASIRIKNAFSDIKDILMSAEYIQQLYNESKDLSIVQQILFEKNTFSIDQIAMHMVKHLSGRIAFCIESMGKVIRCGSTRGTHAYNQWEGDDFEKTPYLHYTTYSINRYFSFNTHWWQLDNNFDLPEDNRSWREILDKISNDIFSGEEVKSFKMTINGKLSGAHGNLKRKNPNCSLQSFIEDVIQRFNNAEYKAFVEHPDFLAFINKRCKAFFGQIDK